MGGDRPEKTPAQKYSVGEVVGHAVIAHKIAILEARFARATTPPYIWDWHYFGKMEGLNSQLWFRETTLEKLR